MPRSLISPCVALVTLAVATGPVSAQSVPSAAATPSEQTPTPGLLFTPSIVYSTSWDDNVLLHGDGDATEGDYLSVVNPKGQLEYTGRRVHVGANYDGAFLLYRNLGALNSYDQHASAFLEQTLSRRVRLFLHDTAAITPTTDAVEFVGVPFVRTGSKIDDLRGGIAVQAARHTLLTAAYDAQWVSFHTAPTIGTFVLLGGHSQGGTLSLKQQVAARLALTADYAIQFGTVVGLPTTFGVQNTTGGFEYRVTSSTTVSAGLGISHLSVSDAVSSRTGPAWQAALSHRQRKALLELAYGRSFVPSYGFGGTQQNEEVTARVHGPLGRRLYAQTSVAWRRNEPLTVGELKLVSWWFEGALGFNVRPWMRVEGFYNGVRQTIDRPGGLLNRNRIGVQLVAAQPVRMQ